MKVTILGRLSKRMHSYRLNGVRTFKVTSQTTESAWNPLWLNNEKLLTKSARARAYSKRNWNIAKKKLVCFSSFFFRAICVWPWDENVRTKQKQKRNGNRAIWLVYRMDKNAGDFCLVKRTFQTSTDNSLWPYTVTRLANRKMPWPSPY